MKFIVLLLIIYASTVSAQNQHPLTKSASIHFALPDTLNAAQWYSEVIVNNPTDNFYGNTFSKGMLGLTGKKEDKRLVFQLVDSIRSRAKLVGVGLNVDGKTPGVAAWKYDWQPNVVYKLLVNALADSVTKSTFYAGYIFLAKEQQWKYIATWQVMNDGKLIKDAAITIATSRNKKDIRQQKLSIQSAWVQRSNGSWKPLTVGIFTSNGINGGVGTDSGRMFIAGKRFAMEIAPQGANIQSAFNSIRPVVSVTNNIDSLAQLTADIEQINNAVARAVIDTMGSVEGVYYSILKPGTGNYVVVTDTVTVFYKGSLLSDGSVFDATKEKPATFPLNRLIKGWQLALVKCRVGGTVRIIIPSGLAYSTRLRSKNIPPNSVLVFDIEVVDAKKGA